MREFNLVVPLYRFSLAALTILCLSHCGRFGIESLDGLNTSSLGNASISSSLASNLKADMTAAGVDANSAQLIADNAVSLSSSLEASVQTSFAANAAQLSESSLYSSVSAKFTEGAMAGIKIAADAGMSASLKATAAGINSYTPIRSMSTMGGLTEEEKAAVSESISSTAVANMQSAGFSTAELSSALKEVTKKAVAAVAKSGVSPAAMQTMVQKAAGGATKGLNTLATKAQSSGDSSFTVDIGTLAQDVAKGSVEGVSEVATIAGNDSAADLLSSVTSGLTAALVSIQEENPTFSASDALTSVTTAVTTQATSSLQGVISEEQLNSTISTATSNVLSQTTSNPVFSQPTYIRSTVEITISSQTKEAILCYTTDEKKPTCSSTKDTCSTGTLYKNDSLSFNASTSLKAVACKANHYDSAIITMTVAPKSSTPIFSEPVYTKSNVAISISSETEEAILCYTTDGSSPSCSSSKGDCDTGSLYASNSLNFSTSTSLKAMACKADYSDSTIASTTIAPLETTLNPEFIPTYTKSNVTISIVSQTKGAILCYTTDESSPACTPDKDNCALGIFYANSLLNFSTSTSLKALACKANFSDSGIVSQTVAPLPIAADPVFTSPTYTESTVSTSISSITKEATLCYTTNSSSPSCSSTKDNCTAGSLYTSGSLTFSASTDLRAIACKADHSDSKIVLNTIAPPPKTEPPVFSQPTQPIYADSGLEVSISSQTEGATLCYTTDGSSPSCISTKDACATGTLYNNKPLFLNSSTDLKAIACKPNYTDSSPSSALYYLVPAYAATLESSPEYVVVAKAQTEAGADASFEQIDLQTDGSMGLYLREDFDKDQSHADGEIMAWLRMKTGSYVIDKKKITVLKVALSTLNEWQTISFPTGYASKAVILGNKITVANPSSKGSSYKRFSQLDIDYTYSGTTHTLKIREETDPSETNTGTATEYASLIIMEEGVYRAGTGEVLWTAQNIQSTGSWTGLSHTITSSDLLGQVTSESSTAFMRLDVEETSTTNYNLKLEGDDTGGGNTAITATETVGILLMNKASLSLPEALANGNASWSSATLDSNEYRAVSAPSQIAWTTNEGDLSPTIYDCAVHANTVQPQIQLQATTGSTYSLSAGPLPGSMTLSASGLLSGYPVHETIGNVASYPFTAKISKYDSATQQLNVAERSFTLKVQHGELGSIQECPAANGSGLHEYRKANGFNISSSANGWYWIQRTTNYSTHLATRTNFGNMPNPVRMYVDLGRGGYDYYCFAGNGASVNTVNANHSGIAMGLDLVYPRSQAHWASMYDVASTICSNGGNHNNYFQTTYAVYNVTNPNSGGQAMYSQNANNGGWRVPDGYQWYLKNTTVGEPNGDYSAYALLNNNGVNADGSLGGFNDNNASYYTGSYYFVSTNAKLE